MAHLALVRLVRTVYLVDIDSDICLYQIKLKIRRARGSLVVMLAGNTTTKRGS